jgi:UDP-N-acetylglucosamine transferase subunit ALG13
LSHNRLEGKKVLIGLLDWGLGHTARTIPIITYLLQFQCQIFIAATNEQRKMLENEFTGLEFIGIEGYNVRYGDKKGSFTATILLQLPRLYGTIRRERTWLEEQMNIHHFDLVISDNRYGLYHPGCISVFITHQLNVISGLGVAADRMLRKIHYSFIKRFSACWVPDTAGSPNLSGILGHPGDLPESIDYLGPLSRLEPMPPDNKLDLLIILSGPEPQRSILESKLIAQLGQFKGSFLLVRGMPSALPTEIPFAVNYLGSAALNQAISNAGMVISRSGYTSIMDLVKLQKKAILIPTPGQTEQEYLARHLDQQGIFMRAEQQSLNIEEILRKAASFPFNKVHPDFNQYRSVLSRFIQSLP